LRESLDIAVETRGEKNLLNIKSSKGDVGAGGGRDARGVDKRARDGEKGRNRSSLRYQLLENAPKKLLQKNRHFSEKRNKTKR